MHTELAEALHAEHRRVHQLRSMLLARREEYLADLGDPAWLAVRDRLAEFAGHVDRHFSFEEQEGFMVSVLENRPALAPNVAVLRDEHDRLRTAFLDLVALFDETHVLRERRALVTGRLDALLVRLDMHERAEDDLVSETVNRELGAMD